MIALLAAFGLADTAVVTFESGRPILIYLHGARRRRLEETPLGLRGGEDVARPAQTGLDFQGSRYVARSAEIVNTHTGGMVSLSSDRPPYDGLVFRCKGALSLGKTMMWIFGWDAPETSLEPSAKVEAYEIEARHGSLKVLRQAVIPGATGYAWGLTAHRYGNTILLNLPELKTAAFDLGAWKERAAWTNSIISPSGKGYQWEDGVLKTWPSATVGWKVLRKQELGNVYGVYDTGFGDMLAGDECLTLVRGGASYPLPKEGTLRLFLKPRVGIGVVWRLSGPNPAGVMLDPATLHVICPILFNKSG